MEIWELAIRESVRQTLADYTAGTDRNRIEDVAACFAPDGALTFTGGEPMVGPAAIVAGTQRAGGSFRRGPGAADPCAPPRFERAVRCWSPATVSR